MSNDSAWMLPQEAFSWIEDHIAPGSTILEFGSGQGSKHLAQIYDLFSVEHNPEFLKSESGTFIYAPILLSSDYPGEIGWYDIEKVKQQLPEKIDLMIIDGPTGLIGRSGLLSHTGLFSWDFPVLIDDLHREREYLMSQHL